MSLALVLALAAAPPSEPGPWRLGEAIGLPAIVRVGLEHRARFEHLSGDFRPSTRGQTADALSLRTLLRLELRPGALVLGVELADARAHASDGAPLTSAIVNPLDLLQAYVGLHLTDFVGAGDSFDLRAGRLTLDVGSRRLVARNDFRNTINAFTGVDAEWRGARRHSVRVFAVSPVRRRPSGGDELLDNSPELDEESPNALLLGAVVSVPVGLGVAVELFALGLSESDATEAPTADRRLVTLGARVHRRPADAWDFQLEVALQRGSSRASASATDDDDLDHRAASLHASVGRRFDAWANPRLALHYDFASGDSDPRDGVDGRFDPLFGARRFDLGPAGLYGAVARSNLSSPAVRLEVNPHRSVDALLAWRPLWLATADDAWIGAGLRDPDDGDFVGHQVELRARYAPLPGNLAFELGGAVLTRSALGGPADPTVYVYSQLTGTI